jgi:uncharacterized membrane protein
MCELLDRFGHYAGTEVYMLRLTAVLAALFLTAWQHSKQKVVYGILFAVSAFNLLYACPVLGEEAWRSYSSDGFLPLHDRFIFWALTAALFAAAWFFNRHSLLPVAVVTAVTILLPFAHSLKTNTYNTGNGFSSYTQTIPNAFFYLLLAISAAFFAWWGVRQSSKALINYGIICFALTVLYFYFSDLLDKLDRSFGLMLGGVLFLTGGWLLEWMRRRLVRSIGTAEAAS